MKSFAVISLFVSVALASSSIIPTGISSGCSTFLTQLDSNTNLTTCTSALITATSQFGPGASGSTPSTATVSTALNNLCKASNPCSETTIKSTLADFYSACQAELTSSLNKNVLQIYDVLFTVIPLTTATCSKDDSGRYCATQIAGTAPSASSLFTSAQEVVSPNFDTLESSNAAFLFLTPSLSSDKLCTSCTRSVMTSYISFESDISYAPGMAQSVLLSGQPALYNAITTTCGANFMSNAVQAAGSLSDGILSGSAPRTVSANAGGIASLLGAVTLAVAAVL
ncbi:hypothetical protein EW026_g6525 [Hermanssonia centrifuga]|uniref:Uncharacterized protein n=1 Tax=Hermanssonia centrifuga TaxID=98765 RepID=A0A4S4KAS7_9APHY|nr:hypothetical protein EW026_g6525 [Hermanssonia centrifuga]